MKLDIPNPKDSWMKMTELDNNKDYLPKHLQIQLKKDIDKLFNTYYPKYKRVMKNYFKTGTINRNLANN